VGIGDSQRIDALAVTGAKPALEVRAPHLVGSRGVRQRLGVGRGSPPLAARHHQAFPPQHLAHGARRRPAPSRLVALQNPLQLPRPPAHMRLPQIQNQLLDLRRRLIGMMPRRPVQFRQSHHSLRLVSSQPVVASLPRDPEALAHIPHRLLMLLILKDKP